MNFYNIILRIFIATCVIVVSVMLLVLCSTIVISFGNSLGWWAASTF